MAISISQATCSLMNQSMCQSSIHSAAFLRNHQTSLHFIYAAIQPVAYPRNHQIDLHSIHCVFIEPVQPVQSIASLRNHQINHHFI